MTHNKGGIICQTWMEQGQRARGPEPAKVLDLAEVGINKAVEREKARGLVMAGKAVRRRVLRAYVSVRSADIPNITSAACHASRSCAPSAT